MKRAPVPMALSYSVASLLVLQGCGPVERPTSTPLPPEQTPSIVMVRESSTGFPAESPNAPTTPSATLEPSPVPTEAGLARLTDAPAPDGFPSWSPDGQQIAFISERDAFPDLYVMNKDGSGPTRLSLDSFHRKLSPSWRPRTRQIALAVVVDTVQVFLIDVDRSRASPFEVGLGLRPVSPVGA